MNLVKFNVLPAVITNHTVLWHMTSYSLVKIWDVSEKPLASSFWATVYHPIFNSGLL